MTVFVVDRRDHYDIGWAYAGNARRSFTEAAKLAHELVGQDGVTRTIFELDEREHAWRPVARVRRGTVQEALGVAARRG